MRIAEVLSTEFEEHFLRERYRAVLKLRPAARVSCRTRAGVAVGAGALTSRWELGSHIRIGQPESKIARPETHFQRSREGAG